MFRNNVNIQPFEKKIWLSSPTMHGEEMEYMKKAYDTNWMSTVGENISALESMAGAHMEDRHAVALSSGTAALHLAVKLAAMKLYGSSSGISTPEALEKAFEIYPDVRLVVIAHLYETLGKTEQI